MIRAMFFLLFLVVFFTTILFFSQNDGQIIIDWMDYRIQTSVAFASLVLIIIIILGTFFLQTILWIKSAPKRYRKIMKERKLNRGILALTRGFAAIAAGDKKQAHELSKRASNNLDNMPLAKLLAAQTAQLEGNRYLANEYYTAMLGDKETEIIAIKGLLIEAKQANDLAKALFLAEKAYKLRPDAQWVILLLIDLYKKLKKWPKAIVILRVAAKRKIISRFDADRAIGLISLAQYQEKLSIADEHQDKYLKIAYKLLPDFSPIFSAYANMLVKKEKINKALKILEKQWSICPHPEIASIYMAIYSGEADEKRLIRAQKFFTLCGGHPEGHALMAEATFRAGDFGKARHHLKAALAFGETRAICKMMADIESIEHARQEAVQYWHQRAEYTNDIALWKCVSCGAKSPTWQITCSNCDTFDSMEWSDYQKSVKIISPHTPDYLTKDY